MTSLAQDSSRLDPGSAWNVSRRRGCFTGVHSDGEDGYSRLDGELLMDGGGCSPWNLGGCPTPCNQPAMWLKPQGVNVGPSPNEQSIKKIMDRIELFYFTHQAFRFRFFCRNCRLVWVSWAEAEWNSVWIIDLAKSIMSLYFAQLANELLWFYPQGHRRHGIHTPQVRM